jgi:hypothetical protein
MKNYHIRIDGLNNPKKFIQDWSKIYNYPNYHKYNDNIKNGFDNDNSLRDLFMWKNGTGDAIAQNKETRVEEFINKREDLKKLKSNFTLEEFESLIQPHNGASIWKIFLLHIIQPDQFPIFDQHVFRSFKFFTKGQIQEIPSNNNLKYFIYKNEYVDWFNNLKITHDLNPREMDKAFFMFGRTLKSLNSETIKIL